MSWPERRSLQLNRAGESSPPPPKSLSLDLDAGGAPGSLRQHLPQLRATYGFAGVTNISYKSEGPQAAIVRSFVRAAAAQLQQRLEEADTAAAGQGQQASNGSSSSSSSTPLTQQLMQLQWALSQLVGSQPLLGPLLNVLQVRLAAVVQAAAAAQGPAAGPAVPGAECEAAPAKPGQNATPSTGAATAAAPAPTLDAGSGGHHQPLSLAISDPYASSLYGSAQTPITAVAAAQQARLAASTLGLSGTSSTSSSSRRAGSSGGAQVRAAGAAIPNPTASISNSSSYQQQQAGLWAQQRVTGSKAAMLQAQPRRKGASLDLPRSTNTSPQPPAAPAAVPYTQGVVQAGLMAAGASHAEGRPGLALQPARCASCPGDAIAAISKEGLSAAAGMDTCEHIASLAACGAAAVHQQSPVAAAGEGGAGAKGGSLLANHSAADGGGSNKGGEASANANATSMPAAGGLDMDSRLATTNGVASNNRPVAAAATPSKGTVTTAPAVGGGAAVKQPVAKTGGISAAKPAAAATAGSCKLQACLPQASSQSPEPGTSSSAASASSKPLAPAAPSAAGSAIASPPLAPAAAAAAAAASAEAQRPGSAVYLDLDEQPPPGENSIEGDPGDMPWMFDPQSARPTFSSPPDVPSLNFNRLRRGYW